MPPPKSEFDREFQLLEAELRRLEGDYNQYFAGRLPRPPWEQRTRVDQMMKRYDRMHIQNTGDRFRFQTLQSRWAKFAELWDRQMNAMETGRRPGMRASRAPMPPPRPPSPAPDEAPSRDRVQAPPPAEPSRPSPGQMRLTDPGAQEDRVQALYEQVSRARKDAGEKPVEYARFTELVRAQVRKHGTGGKEVAFQVDVKNGKVTLSAKASEKD
ncbi:MAG: MXAN_5187 C-terminal domain-containing protein [Vicinamibacterales bacterium]